MTTVASISTGQVTPTQMKFMIAHKERQARMAAAVRRAQQANDSKKPEPVIDVAPVKAKQAPTWMLENVHFDAHVIAYRRWCVAVDQVRGFQTHGEVFINMPEQKKPVKDIIDEVLKDHPGITLDDLKGPRRAKKYIIPRHLAIYEVHRQRPDLSYPQIGRIFGGKDHTSILSAVRKITAQKQKEMNKNTE